MTERTMTAAKENRDQGLALKREVPQADKMAVPTSNDCCCENVKLVLRKFL